MVVSEVPSTELPHIDIWRARHVVTLDGPDAEAVAVQNGRVVGVGAFDRLCALWPKARRTEIDGVILPGFHDAHLHFLLAVRDEQSIAADPVACPSVSVLLKRIADRADNQPSGSWILASGYDDSSVSDAGELDRQALDRVAPAHAVVVTHVAGHWGVVNTLALESGGYTDLRHDPPGGVVGRDSRGVPNGFLFEVALAQLETPEPGLEEWLASARAVNARFHSAGLTSVGDAFVRSADIERFRVGVQSGDITLRIAMLVDADDFDPSSHLDHIDDRLTFSGVKWFMDGAIGGRTALIGEPYSGSDDCGIEVTDARTAEAIATRVHTAGARVAVHANGDTAIRNLLGALEAVAGKFGPLVRPRVEHCSIVDQEILGRLRALGAVVLPFAAYTRMYGRKLVDWYGEERVERMFAVRAFVEAGIHVGASTDHPVAPVEPLNAIQAMVTRQGRDDAVGVGVSQRITVEEALRIYTLGSAFVEAVEHVRGKIAPDYVADFTVLEEDPRRVDPSSLTTIRVLATVVGGETVWVAS